MSNARSAPAREAVTSEPGGGGVHFDVLEPLRARRGDVDVPLGCLQQRVVLALLPAARQPADGAAAIDRSDLGVGCPDLRGEPLAEACVRARRAIEPDRAASGNPGAKTAETRQRRIRTVVEQMHEGLAVTTYPATWTLVLADGHECAGVNSGLGSAEPPSRCRPGR